MEGTPVKKSWFTYAMDGREPVEFDTLRDAVKSAQAEIGTDRRPKRLEHGMYFIAGGNGYSRYIGTPAMFEACGYAWATARMKVGSAAAMSITA
jgi:hypothetical protein